MSKESSMSRAYYLTYGVDSREASRKYYESSRRDFLGCLLTGGVFAVMIALAVFAIYKACTAERDERAAYCQGYYGVDRDTALAMADQGLGKTAAEVLQ